MAPVRLENEDHRRDADFNRAMHRSTAGDRSAFLAMLKKDPAAQKAAVDEYFKHWDRKPASTETDKDREVSFEPRWRESCGQDWQELVLLTSLLGQAITICHLDQAVSHRSIRFLELTRLRLIAYIPWQLL
jgi:sterol 24-C-methyltransferase